MSKEYRKNLTIRVGQSEREYLEKCAKKEGVSLTRYIRQVALGELPQSNKNLNGSSISQKEFLDLYKELQKIGTNLNQIAHKLNVQSARRKANGQEDFDLSTYPVKKVKALIGIYEITNKNIDSLRALIREVV